MKPPARVYVVVSPTIAVATSRKGRGVVSDVSPTKARLLDYYNATHVHEYRLVKPRASQGRKGKR